MNKVRCAIYTRKSSEDGLEQDFNSLHAQRGACAAYILSQASEGWSLLPEEYDDGGLSGGTLKRPALQRLLADISAGKIDIVVVYKVDRLTRSLLDFAKLVEALDKANTSFVSVTQSFNTTTSMGRLTLNMLLSFAQFEREVTAERIRDKIAASKAKGMWMGGIPPLGYKPDGRSLAIVKEHAELIRELFRRYLELGNVRLLADRLALEGVQVPIRTSASGRQMGGRVFSRGHIYAILSNPTYTGKIRHKGRLYDGNHTAIIEGALWEKVRNQLADNAQGAQRGATQRRVSTLAGLLFDEDGEPLVASHAVKDGVRYRYYVSRGLQHGTERGSASIRMPALVLEAAIAEELAGQLDQPLQLVGSAGLEVQPHQMNRIASTCLDTAARLKAGSPSLLRKLISRVEVGRTHIMVEVCNAGLASCLGAQLKRDAPKQTQLRIQAQLRRSGRIVRLVEQDGNVIGRSEPQQHLTKLMRLAHGWWAEMQDQGLSAAELARRHGVDKTYVSRVVRLSFLSPGIIQRILAGEQPAALNARRLLGLRSIPLSWDEQEKLLLSH